MHTVTSACTMTKTRTGKWRQTARLLNKHTPPLTGGLLFCSDEQPGVPVEKEGEMRMIWVIKVNACQWYCLPFVLPPQPWLSVALLPRLGVGPTRAVVQPLMLFAPLSPAQEVLQSLSVGLPPCLMRCRGAIFWRLGRCNDVNNLCQPEAVLLLLFFFFWKISGCSCSWLKRNLVALLVNLLDSWVCRKAFFPLLYSCSFLGCLIWFKIHSIRL